MAEEERTNEKLKKAYMQRLKAIRIEQQKRELAKRYTTAEAYERLMNVRISNYELYEQLVNLIIAMVQNNRIMGKLTEEQLKDILAKLTYKPESSIQFRHK